MGVAVVAVVTVAHGCDMEPEPSTHRRGSSVGQSSGGCVEPSMQTLNTIWIARGEVYVTPVETSSLAASDDAGDGLSAVSR